MEVAMVLDALVAVSEAVRLSFLWRPVVSDPGDDMVLETAVNGRAGSTVATSREPPASSR